MRWRAWAIAATWALGGGLPALAHHRLRQDVGDLFGPGGWGLYLILPLPLLVIGVVAWRLRRAVRRARPADGAPRPPELN